MDNQQKVIKFERYTAKEYIIRNTKIAFSFATLFVIIGFVENNLILSDSGLGLLEHINIWVLLFTNCIIPFVISRIFKKIQNSVDPETWRELQNTFYSCAQQKSSHILINFMKAVGFCFFVGNSLQNANIINHLPFDYWDSIKYIASYIVSRFYKLYLFTFFLPSILFFVYLSIKSLAELLVITDKEMEEYPIKNYEQLKKLCDCGLNILLTMAVYFILLSAGVLFVHNRLDIISISSIIISTITTLVLIYMYILLIKKFRKSIIEYKEKNIKQINSELTKIHKYVFDFEYGEKNKRQFETYVKKEKYLCKVKKKIEKLSQYPFVKKAMFTSFSPFIPTLVKLGVQLLKTFSKLDILAAIL